MDEMIQRGRIGLMKTMYEGLPLGSLVGIMGIFGYNPPDYVPRGRSIFEAYAMGVKMGADDLVSRCNIVRVDESGALRDFTAGQINDEDALAYLKTVKVPANFEIHHDNSYRNVLICRDNDFDDTRLRLFEPHENMGCPIDEIMPLFDGEPYAPLANLMLDSRRGGLMLWPWGAGRIRDFPRMPYRCLAASGLSFLYGMATLLGGKAVIPEGATGYRGSNLRGKLQAVLDSLDEMDVCLIHCNAPDEEAHVHNVMGKAKSIEEIDGQILQPLLRFLETYPEPCRVAILPDHYTVCETGRHLPDLVPYVMFGHDIEPNHALNKYSEMNIINAAPPVMESPDLIPIYLYGRSRI
jgi:2,3-bisphosphoglycerate-independent phosphoglycerate mutase